MTPERAYGHDEQKTAACGPQVTLMMNGVLITAILVIVTAPIILSAEV
jgi:hypothetical protein